MTTFLLTISLLLNGISIYFIFILYSRQNRLLEIEKTQTSFKKEIEDEVSAFLFELKEENEEFLTRFQQMNKTFKLNGNPSNETITLASKNLANINSKNGMDGSDSKEKDWEEAASQVFKKQAVKIYQQTISGQGERTESEQEPVHLPEHKNDTPTIENEEIYRDLLINQIKILQDQGFSIDEIAQKLNKGKTEIELLLKFD